MALSTRGILIFLMLALLAPYTAQAARGFGTLGAGGNDVVDTTAYAGHTTLVSYAIWMNAHSAGGVNFGQVFNHAHPDNDQLFFQNGTTTMSFQAPWLPTGAVFRFNAPSLDTWHHICIAYDATSVANVPVVYIDGSSVSVSTFIAPIGTRVANAVAMKIGNEGAGGVNFDGKLAEYSEWSSVLSASECLALSKGASSLSVRRGDLTAYMPLLGQTGEPAWGTLHFTTTITGTLFQPHPAVQFRPILTLP